MIGVYDQGSLTGVPKVLLRLRQTLAALIVFGVLGVVGYVSGSLWTAGAAPIVREVPVFVRSEPLTSAATVDVPAVRAPRRLLLVGDSSLSLWQADLAAGVAASGRFLGFDISTVKPLAEEGKLPCYFEHFRPVEVLPGDLVAVSFTVSGRHRTEDDVCRNSVAGAGMFYSMAESFVRYVEAAGGEVVAFALPSGQGLRSFTGEPWYAGMSPDQISAWWADRTRVVGEACRASEVRGPDGFHVDPSAVGALAACFAGLS